jgi:hypothetical protein
MTDIYVVQDINYENLGGYDPDDEWTRDSTAQYVSLVGWSEDKPDYHRYDYELVAVEFEPKRQDTLYALCISYDTGDSFGCDEGKHEVVHLFRNKGVAEDNLKALGDLYSKGGDLSGGEFVLKLDNGEELKTYVPYMGYFEYLNDVYVEGLEHCSVGRVSYFNR